MDNNQRHEKAHHLYRDKINIDFLIHDLKSPLVVIEAGISALLNGTKKYGPLTEKQEKVLKRALRNTKFTQTLVKDTLELGRSTEGVFKIVACRLSNLVLQVLVEVLDRADAKTSENIKDCVDLSHLREILQDKGISLFINEGLWFREIYLDELKTKQIFRNLLSNALKYRKSRVELALEEKEGCLVFSVKDDGQGIKPIYHKKVFDCYFQADGTNYLNECGVRGHGLGLACVKILSEDMGGKLFLESDEGKGTKFLVKVPLANKIS